MTGKTLSYALGAVIGMGGAASVSAQDTVNPGGPWVTPNQEISLEGYLSNEELVSRLTRIAEHSKQPMTVESIATTAAGRDVRLVKIGDSSKTPVMIITQQHGDEPHGTEAVLDLIQRLSNTGAFARAVLDELFVLIVPRVNPDGTSFPDRGNGALDAPPNNTRDCFNADGTVNPGVLDRGRGVFTDVFRFDSSLRHYDVNRYHWADWSQSDQIVCNPGRAGTSRHFDPALNPVPEAQGVVDAYNNYGPIWVIDVHNQGPSVVVAEEAPENDAYRPDRLVTGSILWPTNPNVAPEAVDFSKQIALVMKKRSMALGNMEITRYVGGDFAGIARNAYGLFGSDRLAMWEEGPLGGSVLVEILGQTEGSVNFNLGQKAVGMLRNNARELLEAVLLATADGSLLDEDPAQVDELILSNDVNIGNPHTEEEEGEAEEHAAE